MDPDTRAAWYLNRWRLSDFKGALERAGNHILKLDVNATFPLEESRRRTLDTRFYKYSLEDLSATGRYDHRPQRVARDNAFLVSAGTRTLA